MFVCEAFEHRRRELRIVAGENLDLDNIIDGMLSKKEIWIAAVKFFTVTAPPVNNIDEITLYLK